MRNIEINNLIAKRPKAYGRCGFQRFLLWTFIILGIILLVNTAFIIMMGFVKVVLIDEASQEVAARYQVNKTEVEQILIKYLDPIKYKAILYSFFLSISFFILSRYCQKTINRNRYIIRLEQEWKKLNLPE